MTNLPLAVEILSTLIYVLVLVYTGMRILLDTPSTPKTLAYLILVIFLPLVGIIFYYSFGINYRHKKSTRLGIASNLQLEEEFKKYVNDQTRSFIQEHPYTFNQYDELVHFIHRLGNENMGVNTIQLLTNGEEKFPEVLRSLKEAKYYIHMEYYDWENDTRGNQIKDVLLERLSKGVNVRIMFDDYASRGIKKNIVRELQRNGAEIYPVIKVRLDRLANRLNHRDHRKVIIIDGHTGFLGGINISDRYDNSIDTGLYWRDTHVKIVGDTVKNLQRHFLVNWNACQANPVTFDQSLFPEHAPAGKPTLAQVVAGGPVYPMSNIMLTYLRVFTLAREKLYITNPYFIPNQSIFDALKQAAISGVDIRIMVPKKSDSKIVGAASRFYYEELLHAGVGIYEYRKGFVHAKTVVADSQVSIVGTANMDIRSFDLNYEMMSVIYGNEFSEQLENEFLKDLEQCDHITYEMWQTQPLIKKLLFAIARLISAFL